MLRLQGRNVLDLGAHVLILLTSAALGWFITHDPQIAFLLAVVFLGVLAVSAPAGIWVAAALVVAIGLRGLVTLGVLPPLARYLDMPLCWGALGSALIRSQSSSPLARRHLACLSLLGLAVLLSALFHPAEPVRPLAYLLLIGEPFALIGALLLDPPSPRLRKTLTLMTGGLIAMQIPLAYFQASAHGLGDRVQGSLYGAGAGAHTMSSIVTLGAAWLLSGLTPARMWRLPASAALLAIPLLAQAKQVIFAAPTLLLFGRWRGSPPLIVRAAIVVVAAVAIYTLAPLPSSTTNYLDTAKTGNAGKPLTAKLVWGYITSDPASFVFGKGPAETVSRLAFLTTPLQQESSGISILGLHPAPIAMDVDALVKRASGADVHTYQRTSFNSAISSGLGLIGDLGLLGALAFGALLWSLVLALWRSRSRLAGVAEGGLAMYFILGFVFDWWEQPPFTLVCGLLIAMALTDSSESEDHLDRAVTERATDA